MSGESQTGKGRDSKGARKMSMEELENYRHKPETELSVLIQMAVELEEYAGLKDYLQHVSENEPYKVNEKDSVGMSALHCAVAFKNNWRQTQFICAVVMFQLPSVILLLKYGADVDSQDSLGFTPLFLATGRYPDVEIAGYLIEEGKASILTSTKTGATALHGAALQGNVDCVKLLLSHGADPRVEDEDGTTPFDLAKDDTTKSVLHEALIETDNKQETYDAVCAQCKKCPDDGLKRCSRCHVTMYCSRDCQVLHWKKGGHKDNCLGYVLARPLAMQNKKDMHQLSLYHVMGSGSKNVKVYEKKASDGPQKTEFLRNKRFVVKVQLPLGVREGDMMVYNADRTVEGFIYSSEKGYHAVADKIHREGYVGIKAFFWAELTGKPDGSFKVFHGKVAPFQRW